MLDCGEDKVDDHIDNKASVPDVYGGVNVFHDFRERESQFVSDLKFDDDGKIIFAISHIAPSYTTPSGNRVFNIERELYGTWVKELEELGVNFMLSGHVHRTYILPPYDSASTNPASYPVIIGSERYQGKFMGTAIVLNKDNAKIMFTDQDLQIVSKCEITF